jgi:hypothetical protein
MNERIKQLWDKAAESTAAFPSGQNNSWETQVNFMEKFAELIVQECVKIVRPDSYFRAYPDNMIGGEDGIRLLEIIANQIEEHFDPEE